MISDSVYLPIHCFIMLVTADLGCMSCSNARKYKDFLSKYQITISTSTLFLSPMWFICLQFQKQPIQINIQEVLMTKGPTLWRIFTYFNDMPMLVNILVWDCRVISRCYLVVTKRQKLKCCRPCNWNSNIYIRKKAYVNYLKYKPLIKCWDL